MPENPLRTEIVETALPNPLAIVGSRNYPDLDEVREYVWEFPDGTLVVSGGAEGVDTVAERAAIFAGLPKPLIFKPDYRRYGSPRAQHIRNDQIISYLVENAGGLTAFWDGKSDGTASVITKAIKAGVLYEVREPK